MRKPRIHHRSNAARLASMAGLLFAAGAACGDSSVDGEDAGARTADASADAAGDAGVGPVADAGCQRAAAVPGASCTAGPDPLTDAEGVLTLPLASSKIAVTNNYLYVALTGAAAGQPSRLARIPLSALRAGKGSFQDCLAETVFAFEGSASAELVDIAAQSNDGVCMITMPASLGKADLRCLDGGSKVFRTRAEIGGAYVVEAESPTSLVSRNGRVFWTAKWPLNVPNPPPDAKPGSDIIFSYGGGGGSARVENKWHVVRAACAAHYDATVSGGQSHLVATSTGLAVLAHSTDNGGRNIDPSGRAINCDGLAVFTFDAGDEEGTSSLSYTYENDYASLTPVDLSLADTTNQVFAMVTTPNRELAFAQAREPGDVNAGGGYLVTNRAYRSPVSVDGSILAVPSGSASSNVPFVFTQSIGGQIKLRGITLASKPGSAAAAWSTSPVTSDRVFEAGAAHALVASSAGLFLSVVANAAKGCAPESGYIARIAQ